MLEVLVDIGGVVGLFAVFDMLAREDHKQAISDFVFARRPVSFRSFESHVIQGLMAWFMCKNHLLPWRVFCLSCAASLIFLIWALLYLYNTGAFAAPQGLISWGPLALALLIAPILSWPFDLYSLRVTQALFIDRMPHFPRTVPLSCWI
jgi:hypothetical protein